MADRYRGSKDIAVNATEKSTSSTTGPETGSENLYVDLRCDPRTRPVLPATEFTGSHKKKATSSFQITSVTVQGSRMGNDGGEDSADDLDESHTEDASSDMLDCSKTTDLENDPLSSDNSNANLEEFGLVGLVLPNKQSIPVKSFKTNETPVNFSVPLSIGVSADFGDVAIEPNVVNSGVTLVTSTTTSPPVVNAQVPMVNSLPEHWQHRFKVVKIVSSEPFKRGRWLCMDFTDPPVIHNDHKLEAPESGMPNTEHTIIGTGPSTIQNELADRSGAMTHVYEIPVVNQSTGLAVTVNANQHIAQPVYSIIVPVTTVTTTSTVTIPATVNISVAGNAAMVHNAASQTATSEAVPSQQQATQTPPSISNVLPQTIPVNLQTQALVHPLTNNQISQPNQATQVPNLGGNVIISSVPSVISVTNSTHPVQMITASAVANGNISNLTAQEASNLVSSHLTGQQSASDLVAAAVRIATPLVNPPLSDALPDTLGTKSLQEGDDSESAPSGTSTVAIDNKIEQAMDLVKSHLMFAVREEVDVLKEKITELVDRISQLELENGILRANASQETLSQLPSRAQVAQPNAGQIHMIPGGQAAQQGQPPQSTS